MHESFVSLGTPPDSRLSLALEAPHCLSAVRLADASEHTVQTRCILVGRRTLLTANGNNNEESGRHFPWDVLFWR
jgi:hypothetical protein